MGAPLAIGDRLVGAGQPCFVIAELGVNHDGDVGVAHALIDAAADAGADAIKFQTFVPDALAAPGAPTAEYQKRAQPRGDQRDMLARLALDEAAHVELKAHVEERGALFLSSPFDDASVALLERLGVAAFKIPSGEITNHPFLRLVARTGKPVILSTGMSTLDEVIAARAALGDVDLVLLHCVSSYPADARDCNLRAIDTLRAALDVPVGWSDHTEGIAVALAAAARGACLIEKHLTLDRRRPGPDHAASLEPGELAAMVAGVRAIEAALGDGVKRPTAAEADVARVARKSLCWRAARPAGHRVTSDDLVAMRPGTGLPPAREDELIGRRLARAVSAGSLVALADLEEGAAR